MAKQSLPAGVSRDGAGLRIRLYKHGKPIYSETLKGDPYSPSHIAAAKKRREWLTARLKLGLPLVAGEDDSSLFEDMAQGYLNVLDAKHSTHLSYENILNRYWMPVFAGRPVHEITTREIKNELARLDVSPKTRRNILGPLRGVLDHGEVNPNPCAGIRLNRRKQKTGSPISYNPAQRSALMAAIEAVPVSDWLKGQPAAYFALLFGCGLRPCGEPLALQWNDYDGEVVTIDKQITKRKHQAYTKTDVARRVYVPSWVRPYLDTLPSRFGGEHLFLNSAGGPHLDTDHFNKVWKRAHKKARIPYQTPYACRHTRASELLSTGIAPADAAKQLGHSLEMFTNVYAEWIEEFAGKLDLTRFEGHTTENAQIRS